MLILKIFSAEKAEVNFAWNESFWLYERY